MEIDLHIEELLENYSGMNNAEIVQIQLKHFQNALDTAINNHYKKLIVIPGVGNGRLKQEVRNILSANKTVKFYDASYSRYGFGATEIAIS
jgi:dsDNA-specific endonuclease/ATPase MutS2